MNHDIVISAPRGIKDSLAPAILQRSDEDFVDAVMDDLKTDIGRTSLQGSLAQARGPRNVLKLYQPIQRQFHVAMIEAWCDAPGTPRVDPAKVDSAGMVVRRVKDAGYEGWMRAKGRVRGWVGVDRLGNERSDPTSTLRLASKATGVADIDRSLMSFALENEDSLLNEHVIPLFAAPPEVCAAAKKTVYYGLVPTTSAELAEGPVGFEDDTFTAASDTFRNHLVQALRGESMDFALTGETLHPGWFEAVEMPGPDKPEGLPQSHWNALRGGSASTMKRFILMLRQLAVEFDVFGGGVDADAVLDELKAIALPLKLREGELVQRTTTADVFLKNAVSVLLERAPAALATEMPLSWPALDATAANRLMSKLYQAMAARFAAMKGRPGRFDERGATYAVRAFVRLKPDSVCPARTLWSEYSEPFVIAPWYEGSGAPPVQIALPDATDRNLLKSLKPNVAFVVPPALQGLMGINPKDMLNGKGKADSSLTLGWICGFNIPTITICAFIALNILLSLFDLIFQWMAFVKICIPFPKKK
ncbi:MAG TPA: hypothetical protein VEM38_04390 [Burkholderiales bacterium]|nr:hypothetical protein [Burkholderiales bacterium]